MKNIFNTITIVLLFCFVNTLRSQNFEGEIDFKVKYTGLNSTIDTIRYRKILGSFQKYFIKDNRYLSISNGYQTAVQLYRPETNKIYYKLLTTDTIRCFDAGMDNEHVIDYKIEDVHEKIAGYDCKVLIVQTKENKYKFYFSESIKINYQGFSRHKYSLWAFVSEHTQSVPLKTIIETKGLIIESKAEKVIVKQLQDDKFNLPLGATVICN